MSIQSLGPQHPALLGASANASPAQRSRQAGQEFQDLLRQGVQKANQEVRVADQAVQEMVSTQGANLHETMIALEKADIATRLTARVGQKLVQAYKEISQMQV